MPGTNKRAENSADIGAITDKLAIIDVLTLYSRGIDRCDLDALHRVFWPDAVADYGSGPEDAHAWCAGVVRALATMARTQHALSNMLIELEGERATAETYCTAYHELSGPDGMVEMVVGGRYLDRLERRGAEWRVAERLYVMDWNRNGPSSAVWDQGMYARLTRRGGRKSDDPFYAFKEDRR